MRWRHCFVVFKIKTMIYRALAILMMTVFFPFACLVLLIYAGFCFYVFKAFKWLNFSKGHTSNNTGVSIIVPFRNEADNIVPCIEAIAQQSNCDFPFEIILVNDHSDDDSLHVIRAYQSSLDVTTITSDGEGKKAALLTGIQAAKHPVIHTIDADCRMGKQCLSAMHQVYTGGDLNMLCGLVSYQAKGVFGSLQQAESVALVGISAFMLNSGRPATCNGANLMFSKAMFERVGGYGTDQKLSSGDDDLLMQTFATYQPDKVKYATIPTAVVYTAAETSVKAFVSQRMRWTSKRRSYKYYYNTILMLMLLSKQLVFWMAFGVATVFGSPWLYLINLVLLMSDALLYVRFRQLLPLKWYTLVLMPFYQLYIFIIPVFNLFVRNTWKGRTVVKG